MRRLPHKLNDLRSVLVMDNPPVLPSGNEAKTFSIDYFAAKQRWNKQKSDP